MNIFIVMNIFIFMNSHPQTSPSLVILIWNMQASGTGRGSTSGIGRGSHFAEGGEFISSGKKMGGGIEEMCTNTILGNEVREKSSE